MKIRSLKSILSKWLFTAMVVLSFFTFSGFVSPSTIKIAAPSTTLVAKSTGGFVKSVCYRLRSKLAANKVWFNRCPVNDFAKLSYTHTKQVLLLVKQTAKPVANNAMIRFYRAAIYPQTLADGTDLI
jgi:hypothetical protein